MRHDDTVALADVNISRAAEAQINLYGQRPLRLAREKIFAILRELAGNVLCDKRLRIFIVVRTVCGFPRHEPVDAHAVVIHDRLQDALELCHAQLTTLR